MRHGRKTKIALIAADPNIMCEFDLLSDLITNEKYEARTRKCPRSIDEEHVADAVTHVLRGQNFAVVAITGGHQEIESSARVALRIRRRMPLAVVMCPAGFARMSEEIHRPELPTGIPSCIFDIRMTILLGKSVKDFPGWDNRKFGPPTCIPAGKWRGENAFKLAERIREAAQSRI